MRIEFNFGTSVLVLPADVKKYINGAGKSELAVLLAVSGGGDVDVPAVASLCKLREAEVSEALAFWRGTGIISTDTASSEKKESVTAKAPTPKSYSMTGAEIERVCVENPTLKTTIEKCQTIFGKVFGTSESGVFVYLYDHLRLDCEYILLLSSYCKRTGHDSVRYFEKTALGLFDDGIDTVGKLEKYFMDESRRGELEMFVRKLYGMGARALTSTEKEYLRVWSSEWDMSEELIEAAYEEMMKNLPSPKMSYENKILKNWYDAGVKTVAEAKEKGLIGAAKSGKKDSAPSFDLGEFFELAVQRGKAESENK